MKHFLGAAFIATLPTLSIAEVKVSAPWARATIIAGRPGAGYLSLTSETGDRLLSVSSPVAGEVMLHAVESGENGVSRMVHLDALDLPEGETVTLAPGDMHLMLMQLTQKLEEGTNFPLTLTFETAGEITVEVPVLGIAATGPEGTE
ncbi:copper chaperone PCu(A)C [Leisingera aquimarina]|uniref:copper chaperone PCu(A)C n=1 Tax=Leisingera aquimarina TaxID=476529 RepID=UPI0004255491|nr:copper chaperone PCu(A)C [Leisingera aquimarina]